MSADARAIGVLGGTGPAFDVDEPADLPMLMRPTATRGEPRIDPQVETGHGAPFSFPHPRSLPWHTTPPAPNQPAVTL